MNLICKGMEMLEDIHNPHNKVLAWNKDDSYGPHRWMKSLNKVSFEFIKAGIMLGPYNTSVFPYYYYNCIPYCYCCLHIIIIVPRRSPLLLLLCPCIIIVMSALIILWPFRLLYIERRSCHLYHPRIVHFCTVKEAPPSKRLHFKSLVYHFLLFYELVA